MRSTTWQIFLNENAIGWKGGGQVVRFLNPFPAEKTSEVRQGTCLRGKFLADALWGDHFSSS